MRTEKTKVAFLMGAHTTAAANQGEAFAQSGGITRWDYFAAAALQGLLADGIYADATSSHARIAEIAGQYADAMITQALDRYDQLAAEFKRLHEAAQIAKAAEGKS